MFTTKTAIEWEQWALTRDLPLVAIKEHDASKRS